MDIYNCEKLLNTCVIVGVLAKDAKRDDNIIAYFLQDENYPQGWYSISIRNAAKILQKSDDYQEELVNALARKGVDFSEENVSKKIIREMESEVEIV